MWCGLRLTRPNVVNRCPEGAESNPEPISIFGVLPVGSEEDITLGIANQGQKKGCYLVTCNEAVEKLGGSFSQHNDKM